MASRHITKSKFVAGLQCTRRLWRQVHAPVPFEAAAPGSPMAVGNDVGALARGLHPCGVLVEEAAWEHGAAVARTAALMADRAVPAIFEAAFEAALGGGPVRIRVDLLVRGNRGKWHLIEVKSSGAVKEEHIHDVAIQWAVATAAGVPLADAAVMHIDTAYVRGPGGLEADKLLTASDVTAEVKAAQAELPATLKAQHKVIAGQEPRIEPGRHCSKPHACEHWDHCTAQKPADWIYYLPRLSEQKQTALAEMEIEAISEIPEDFELSLTQTMVWSVVTSGEPYVAEDLGGRLEGFGPPAFYLDFETVNPAIPLWPETSPYQQIPVQWSLLRRSAKGKVSHLEFLATGDVDPRPDFVDQLLHALEAEPDLPIIVYSGFEKTTLSALQSLFPRKAKRIQAVIERLCDLLAVVRGGICLPEAPFGNSIKDVYPALCPGKGYDDLDGIADGAAASAAFVAIAAGALPEAEVHRLRGQLLAYCRRDTEAMMDVHLALLEHAGP